MFDDLATEESNYVMAQVPLLPLAQGKTNVTDTYTLTEVSCLKLSYGQAAHQAVG